MIRLTIMQTLRNRNVAQYTNYNFKSYGKYSNTLLAVNEDGIYSLDDASTDDSISISASFKTPAFRFGSPIKFRKYYLEGEFNGGILMGIKVDDGVLTTTTLAPNTGNVETRLRAKGNRDSKGSVWQFEFSNVSGADFSIDNFQALPIILTQGRV